MSQQLEHQQPSDTVGAALAETRFTPSQVAVIRRMYAAGATDDELAVFLRLAAKYDLDPLAREIWCICELERDGVTRKTDRNGQLRPPMIQASRAGWRKVAQRDPLCAGIESGAVHENDHFGRAPDGGVDHRPALRDRGKLVGAYGLVWRHDWQRPAYAWAPWAEYGAPNARNDDGSVRTWSPWARFPSAMIEKQAESMALRQAFALGGLTSGDDRLADDPEAAGSQPPSAGHQPGASAIPTDPAGAPGWPDSGDDEPEPEPELEPDDIEHPAGGDDQPELPDDDGGQVAT